MELHSLITKGMKKKCEKGHWLFEQFIGDIIKWMIDDIFNNILKKHGFFDVLLFYKHSQINISKLWKRSIMQTLNI